MNKCQKTKQRDNKKANVSKTEKAGEMFQTSNTLMKIGVGGASYACMEVSCVPLWPARGHQAQGHLRNGVVWLLIGDAKL